MAFDDFIEKMISCLSARLGDGYSVTHKKFLKNNSIELDSLVICRDSDTVSPCIYLNSLFSEYLSGADIEEIADSILKAYKDSRGMEQTIKNNVTNFENIEKRVIFRVVSYLKNKRLLENLIYDRVQDLAVIYLLIVSDENDGCEMTIKLDKENIVFFGLTHEKLMEYAFSNTERLYPPNFDRMDNFLNSVLRSNFTLPVKLREDAIQTLSFMSRPELYVLTTPSRENGAGCILYNGILERIRKSLGSDFYIIPSSVNEILIMPDKTAIERDSLEKMVREINANHVPGGEVLSDRVYHYPEDQFVVCPESDPSASN